VTTTPAPAAEAREAPSIAAIGAAADMAGALGRADLQQRLAIAVARIRRPATVVCVVGEFKQGKSSLVNALLGLTVCPTDDDIATSAHTFVRYGERPAVLVHRRLDGKSVIEEVAPASLTDYVTERGKPSDMGQVDRVEIAVPAAFLAGGLVLVDMPGVGGLSTAQAASTLAFLPFADGLIFVSDATAELSAPERQFLADAIARTPTVLMALTKTDIASDWRRIGSLDRGHLDAMGQQGADVEILPVAAPLRRVALANRDDDLDASSGYPALAAALHRRIVAPAKKLADERGRQEAGDILGLLAGSQRTALDLLEHPERLERALAELADAQARLDHLRGPGARWSTLANDRMADIASEASYRFRVSMRTVGRAMDEGIDEIKTPAQWEELGARLQSDVAGAVGGVFEDLEHGVAVLRGEVAETLHEEVGVAGLDGGRPLLDVAALWAGATITEDARLANRAAGGTLVGLRGAQSGLTLFSLVAQFAPKGAMALLMASPLTLGVGLTFAGVQLLDSNRRKIALRRQKARQAVRQFIDDVQFEVTNELSETVRQRQRAIRDEFTERVTEAIRTNTETATRAREDAQRAGSERDSRRAELRSSIERLEAAQSGFGAQGRP
jgi:hypothetical protein